MAEHIHTTGWTFLGIRSNARGIAHDLHARTGDTVPTSGHAAPPRSVLTLTGDRTRGYRSAHRRLARSLGYGTREAEVRSARVDAAGDIVPTVATYWLRDL